MEKTEERMETNNVIEKMNKELNASNPIVEFKKVHANEIHNYKGWEIFDRAIEKFHMHRSLKTGLVNQYNNETYREEVTPEESLYYVIGRRERSSVLDLQDANDKLRDSFDKLKKEFESISKDIESKNKSNEELTSRIEILKEEIANHKRIKEEAVNKSAKYETDFAKIKKYFGEKEYNQALEG